MSLLRTMVERAVRAARGRSLKIHDSVPVAALMDLTLEGAAGLARGLLRVPPSQREGPVFLGRSVRLLNVKGMRFGRSVRLGDSVVLSALGDGITLGANVGIGAYSRLIVTTSVTDPSGHIRIGDNVGLGEFAYLGGAGGVEIGPDTIVGQYLSVHPENHVFEDEGRVIREQGTTRQGIRIGRDCWIGAKVTMLDGVTIGDHCVIAAGAVVTRSFETYTVIGGVPARVLKDRRARSSSRSVPGPDDRA